MKIRNALLTLTLSLTPIFALANTCDGMNITIENTSNQDITLTGYSASTGSMEGLNNNIKVSNHTTFSGLNAVDNDGHTPSGDIYYTVGSGTEQYKLRYDAKSTESECKPDKKPQANSSYKVVVKMHTQNGIDSSAIERFKIETDNNPPYKVNPVN